MITYCKICQSRLIAQAGFCSTCGNVFPERVPSDNGQTGVLYWPPDNPQGLWKYVATISTAWSKLSNELKAATFGGIAVMLIIVGSVAFHKQEQPIYHVAVTPPITIHKLQISTNQPQVNNQAYTYNPPAQNPAPQQAPRLSTWSPSSNVPYPSAQNEPILLTPPNNNRDSATMPMPSEQSDPYKEMDENEAALLQDGTMAYQQAQQQAQQLPITPREFIVRIANDSSQIQSMVTNLQESPRYWKYKTDAVTLLSYQNQLLARGLMPPPGSSADMRDPNTGIPLNGAFN